MAESSKPDSPQVPLIALLFERVRWLDQRLLHELENAGWYGLTRSQSLLFGQLDAGCSNASQIANRIGVSRQAVNRTVHELMDAGYVTLSADSANAKVKQINLTRKGKRLMRDAGVVFANIEEQLQLTLGKRSLAQLRSCLQSDWGD